MELQPFAPEQDREAYELIQACGLGQDESFEAWRRFVGWAVLENPYREGLPPGHVVIRHNSVAAFIYYMYVPFRLGRWEGVVPSVGDYCVSPRHRGPFGFAFARQYLTYSGFAALIGTHVSELTGKIWSRFGAVALPGTGSTYRATLSIRRSLEVGASRRGPLLGGLARAGPSLLGGALGRMAGGKELPELPLGLRLEYPFDLDGRDGDALTELCQKAQSAMNIGVLRTARYLQWRYWDHPLRSEYHSAALKTADGALAGLVVLREVPLLAQVRVAELLWDPEVPGGADEAVAAVVQLGRQLGAAQLLTKPVLDGMDWEARGFERLEKGYDQYWIVVDPQLEIPQPLRLLFSDGDFKLR